MLPVVLILAGVFALLFLTRLGGIHRARVVERWPSLLLAGAALLALGRGAIWPATAFAALAVLAWSFWPRIAAARAQAPPRPTAESPADAEARAILGVALGASEAEIRSAYRAKMAQAHPDRGGKHAEAARLTAARDRLLRKMR